MKRLRNGFIAALANDTTFFTSKAAADFQKEALAGAGEKFLAANAKKPGVKVLPSGLQYKVITEGHGEVPKASDEVEVIYEGRLIDGTVFDATSKHGGSKTDKFRANGLIKGWTEALTLMPVGSKWQVYIPYELAYGERQAGQIPPYSTLVFDLELVSIVKPEVKPEPADEQKEDAAAVKSAIHAEQAKADAAALSDSVKTAGAFQVIAAQVNAQSMDDLRDMADMSCDKLDTGVVVLAAVNDGKVNLVVKASKAAVAAGAHAGKVETFVSHES